MGLDWDEGGSKGGTFGPYRQSERHREIWRHLVRSGWVYPADYSRKEILERNPGREQDGGWLFPPDLRGKTRVCDAADPDPLINWRFRVPDGEVIEFRDGEKGMQSFVAGEDFGDFLVWRKSGEPSYELAVVSDDRDMRITEVVRGEDLLLSTARQILIYRALEAPPPRFRHVGLVCDAHGKRLSKTARSVAIRHLRKAGWTPQEVLAWKA